MSNDPYLGREQSKAKHDTLRRYLQALALKVGHLRKNITINYVDAFAGPWEAKTDDLSDTSPFIAVDQLLRAKDTLASAGKSLTVRAFFVTMDAVGAAQLARLKTQFETADIVIARGTFEENLDAATTFAKQGSDPYSFVFIDPTGWKGVPMQKLAPLLQATRGEVLVNFMLEFVRRFADQEDQRRQFSEYFGLANYQESWASLEGEERDEQMLACYIEQLRAVGRYEHCVSAPIFSVLKDRIHFHLVYATHSLNGLATFRETERGTLDLQVNERSRRQQQERVERRGQGELFDAQSTQTRFVEDRRALHVARARSAVEELLAARGTVFWDELVATALREPLVSETDMKSWVRENATRLKVHGLEARERVPKIRKGHTVEWLGRTSTRPR